MAVHYSPNPNHAAVAIVLAAGKGTRMGSHLPKPLIALQGKPLIDWVLETLADLKIPAIVVEDANQSVSKHRATDNVRYVIQPQADGPAHAVLCGLQEAHEVNSDTVLVLLGDSPLVPADAIRRLLDQHWKTKAALTLLTGVDSNIMPFSQVVRGTNDAVNALVSHATPDVKTKEYSLGPIVFNKKVLAQELPVLLAQEGDEKRLEPIVNLLNGKDMRIATLQVPFGSPIQWGINTSEELQAAEAYLRNRSD
jgi:bifunctional N-acetylglucosamine-1-phosphate-uridyltransferase/glucosamine-1-phosphate-acetyltransferase GlmU-like protein